MDKEIDYAAMGERIRRTRENERLTQEQLAEVCSLSAAHMGHIERGSRKPSLESVFRISKCLHVVDRFLDICYTVYHRAVKKQFECKTKREIPNVGICF